MRRLGIIAVVASVLVLAAGCTGASRDAAEGADSWIVGAWEGEVVDTRMRIEFAPTGDYEWTMIDSDEPVATGTWSAASETSPVELTQSTGTEFVFSVLPLAVFDGEKLHITAPEDYLVYALVDPDAPPGNVEALMAELRRHPNVASADFVSALDAQRELEATAEQTGEVPGDERAIARIEIVLSDWALQAEFVTWLEDEADFKIVAVGPNAIQEPEGLVFVRAE